jgi:hypothetical protein
MDKRVPGKKLAKSKDLKGYENVTRDYAAYGPSLLGNGV